MRERHPALFEKAKDYEKPEEGFTWIEGESLEELEKPERMKEIKEHEKEREQRLKEQQKPSNLAQAFGYQAMDDPDDALGCMICHI